MHKAAFWRKHPGFVWSDPQAGDEVRIRAALLRPHFLEILDIVEAFSLELVEAEWRHLVKNGEPRTERARPIVERILRNIRKGAERAARRH